MTYAPQRHPAPSPADAAAPPLLLRALAALEGSDAPSIPPERAEELVRRIADGGGGAQGWVSAEERRWLLELRTEVVRAAGHAPRDVVAATMAAFDRVLDGPGVGSVEAVVEFAHDLRSPLTSILFLADALRDGSHPGAQAARGRQVGIIYSAALSMASMTSDIIDFFHAHHDLAGAQAAPFSVRGVMESVADMVRPMLDEGRVELRLVYPARENRIGNSVALARVLLNLSANSLRHTRDGHVEVSAREAAGGLEFSVSDTGPGIPPEVQDALFEPFRPNHRRPGLGFSGTGLGLGICRNILRAVGSDLRFETSPDAGTTFRFTLPLPVAHPPSPR